MALPGTYWTDLLIKSVNYVRGKRFYYVEGHKVSFRDGLFGGIPGDRIVVSLPPSIVELVVVVVRNRMYEIKVKKATDIAPYFADSYQRGIP